MIARVETLTEELFDRNFVAGKQPVIVAGAMKGWRAQSAWTLDYLKTVIGDAKVRVEVSPTDCFPSHLGQDPSNFKRGVQQMRFARYADSVSLEGKTPHRYYLSDASIMDRFPTLAEDAGLPAFLNGGRRINKSFWLGSAGTITPLHYDLVHNLFTQIQVERNSRSTRRSRCDFCIRTPHAQRWRTLAASILNSRTSHGTRNSKTPSRWNSLSSRERCSTCRRFGGIR